jgi:hypothetical protein
MSNEARRLSNELDHAIMAINRERISQITGNVGKTDFFNVAESVSNLRARYLKSVLKLGACTDAGGTDTDHAMEIKQLRQAYEEAVAGFEALEHALRRGYLTLS